MERKRASGRAAVRLSWSGNELRARFTGESIAFSFEPHGVSYYTCGSTSSPAACSCVASAANGC